MLESAKLPLSIAPDCATCLAFEAAHANATDADLADVHGALSRVDAEPGDDAHAMVERWRCDRCGSVWEASMVSALDRGAIALDEVRGVRRATIRRPGPFFACLDAWSAPVSWSVTPQRLVVEGHVQSARIADELLPLLGARPTELVPFRVQARLAHAVGQLPAQRTSEIAWSALATPPAERRSLAWCDGALARFGAAHASRVLGAYRLSSEGRTIDLWTLDVRVVLGGASLTEPHRLDATSLGEEHLAFLFELADASTPPDELRARFEALRAAGAIDDGALPEVHLSKADRAHAAARYDHASLEAWTTLARATPGLLM